MSKWRENINKIFHKAKLNKQIIEIFKQTVISDSSSVVCLETFIEMVAH